jgi:ribose transport system permease protein
MTILQPAKEKRAMATTNLPTAGAPLASAQSKSARGNVLEVAEQFGLPALFALMILVFCLLRPETFATAANFRNIATSQSVLAIAALALILPLTGGRFDVSVGSTLGLCAIVSAALMGKHGYGLVPAIIVTVAVGAAIGLVNGVVVAYLGVNSIIATIGTGTVIGGIVQAYTKGVPITDGISTRLTELSGKSLIGIPQMFLIMLVIAVGTWFLLTQTPYGRNLTATGVNESAARLVGIKVHRVVLGSFVGAGALAGAAGVMQVAAQGSGDPGVGGLGFILPALAAVFLGATTLRPGTYNVPGTIIGLLFVGTAISGLVLMGVEPWVTDVFNGSAVVVAIVISAQLRRRRTGATEMGT